MPTKKSAPSKKKPVISKKKSDNLTTVQKAKLFVRRSRNEAVSRSRALLARRPHRSFQKTRRRDYVRSLKLPGYWAFTNDVRKTLLKEKKLIIGIALLYGALTVLLVGMASQETYTQLSSALRSTSSDIFKGNWGALGQASILVGTGVAGDFGTSLSQVQQMCAVILVLFTWLTTVWLLRAALAGRKPKLRDGLYNAGAPILPTFMVVLVLFVQLLPIIVSILGFAALVPFGILDGGVESMLYWAAAILLTSLSLYWLTSTFVALIVVTLPGMYPMRAIRIAGDLVVGRRTRILFRLLWLLLVIVLAWLVVMVPIILFDTWLKGVLPGIKWLPIVPVMLLVMSMVTTVWSASYIYLLYRRIVDDDAAPA